MINVCLAGMLGKHVHAYLDDIIIMTNTWSDHLVKLGMVLERIANAQMTIKLKKYKFAQDRADILGHTIDADGISPQKDKLESIRKMRPPTNVDEVRRVLGLMG